MRGGRRAFRGLLLSHLLDSAADVEIVAARLVLADIIAVGPVGVLVNLVEDLLDFRFLHVDRTVARAHHEPVAGQLKTESRNNGDAVDIQCKVSLKGVAGVSAVAAEGDISDVARNYRTKVLKIARTFHDRDFRHIANNELVKLSVEFADVSR